MADERQFVYYQFRRGNKEFWDKFDADGRRLLLGEPGLLVQDGPDVLKFGDEQSTSFAELPAIGGGSDLLLNSVSVDATVAALDMGKPNSITIAAAGDSIGMLYPSTSWFEKCFTDLFSTLWYERPVNLRRWSQDGNALGAPTVVQAGGRPSTGVTTGVTLASDSFNNRAAVGASIELVGSTPEVGGPWGGPAGVYTIFQPTSAIGVMQIAAGVTPSLAQPAYLPMAKPTATADHQTDRASRISTNSATATTTLLWSIQKPNGDGVRIRIDAVSSAAPTMTLEVVVNGATRTIGTLVGALATNTQDQVPVTNVTVTGTAISASSKIGSAAAVTVSGTLTADEVTALSGWDRNAVATTDLRFRDDYVTTKGSTPSYSAPSVPPVLLINGCANGTTTDYQQSRIAQMYPVRPDLFLIGHGMNHTDETPDVFLSKMQALVDALHAVYPDVPVGIITENPRYPAPDGAPASRIPDHQARQIALRTYARSRGWLVADAFSVFTKQPDAGYSWVQPEDGKHPNASGQAAMAATLKAAVSKISTRA